MKKIQVIMTVLLALYSISTAMTVNSDAERLYDDLINGYNSLIRPVANVSDRLTVILGLRLSQLIDVVSNHLCEIRIS
jgi:hypothetical protein